MTLISKLNWKTKTGIQKGCLIMAGVNFALVIIAGTHGHVMSGLTNLILGSLGIYAYFQKSL